MLYSAFVIVSFWRPWIDFPCINNPWVFIDMVFDFIYLYDFWKYFDSILSWFIYSNGMTLNCPIFVLVHAIESTSHYLLVTNFFLLTMVWFDLFFGQNTVIQPARYSCKILFFSRPHGHSVIVTLLPWSFPYHLAIILPPFLYLAMLDQFVPQRKDATLKVSRTTRDKNIFHNAFFQTIHVPIWLVVFVMKMNPPFFIFVDHLWQTHGVVEFFAWV